MEKEREIGEEIGWDRTETGRRRRKKRGNMKGKREGKKQGMVGKERVK